MNYFADVTYNYTSTSTASGGTALAIIVVYLLVILVLLAAAWKVFTKAGQAGWKAIIPIYSTIILLKIVNRPVWWLVLFFVPFVNIIFYIIVLNDLSKAFGHGAGMTILLLLLPFIGWPYLAFGSSKYQGAAAASAPPNPSVGGGQGPAPPTQPPASTPPQSPSPPAAPQPPAPTRQPGPPQPPVVSG